MIVHALDPGSEDTGCVSIVVETGEVTYAAIEPNRNVLAAVRRIDSDEVLAIEYPFCRGQLMQQQTIDMVCWIGRFIEAFGCDDRVVRIDRLKVKLAICGITSAKDRQVRQAIIDRYGGQHKAIGAVKCHVCSGKGWRGRGRPTCPACKGAKWRHPPGPLHGIKGDEWSALAVAITFAENGDG